MQMHYPHLAYFLCEEKDSVAECIPAMEGLEKANCCGSEKYHSSTIEEVLCQEEEEPSNLDHYSINAGGLDIGKIIGFDLLWTFITEVFI